MIVNFKLLAKSLRTLAHPDFNVPDSRIQLLAEERSDLEHAAKVLEKLDGLKYRLMHSNINDGKSTDRMAFELISLLGIEGRDEGRS